MKNILIEISKFFIALLICYLIFIFFFLYFFLDNEKYVINNKIWKYSVWEKTISLWFDGLQSYKTICDNDKNCLWYPLEWINVFGNNIYIYIHNYYKDMKNYKIMWVTYKSTKIPNDFKQFWILTQDSVNFYSLNELKKLPKEQQNILLDLKKNPRFIYE